MIVRFNKKTYKLIKKISKKVADKLEVDKVVLVFEIDHDEKVHFYFETDEDDTYASLQISMNYFKYDSFNSILKFFMTNPNVEWALGNIEDTCSCSCEECNNV